MFHICSITDSYCNFLRKYDPHVYDNKEDTRTHTRKYFGIVMSMNNMNYYIPMSSPKPKDYFDEEQTKIRPSSNTIIRIVTKGHNNKDVLRGTLRISNMIPVPIEEIIFYNFENEQDLKYKNLIKNEIAFLSNPQNTKRIIRNANLVYHQKQLNLKSINYLNACCNFPLLEEKCNLWETANSILPTLTYIANINDLIYIYDSLNNKALFEHTVHQLDTPKYTGKITTLDPSAIDLISTT